MTDYYQEAYREQLQFHVRRCDAGRPEMFLPYKSGKGILGLLD